MQPAMTRSWCDQLAGSGATRERARVLKHHVSAVGMTRLPSARPGHLLRSGGSGLGRDGAAYPSYRLTCCETTVCRVTDCFGVWLVPLSQLVWLGLVVGCPIGTASLFSCSWLKDRDSPHPYQGESRYSTSKRTNWVSA